MEGPRHHHHEDILRYVQQAPDDIRWTIDKTEFDDLLAKKKKKTRLLALTEFHMVPTGVPGVWARNSSLMLAELSWKELPFLIILLKVELFSSPRLLTSMTVEGIFDHLTHFAL